MADLPMAQIPNFQLSGPQNVPVSGGPFTQLAQGVQSGLQIGQQQRALAQKQQELQQENGKNIAQNALQAYDAYGDAAGPESFNAFKQGMNMMAPGSVDPNAQWDDSMGEGMKTAYKAFDAGTSGARPWPEVIGVISKTIGTLGAQQRAKMQPLLGAAQDQFNQQQSTQRQQSSQSQDTQRAYAEHAQPLLQTGSSLNTINQLLSENSATGDAQAKTLIERNLANGSISQADADNLIKAGGPLEKLSNYWHTVGTGKTFDDTHRAAMQNWVSTKVKEINNTLQSTATAYPGAQAASVPTRINGTSKSGKPIYSDDGGKSWQYQSQ